MVSPRSVEAASITIVTPSFNRLELLERTMASVLRQGYQRLEFIVVDGGSTDGTPDLLRRNESELRLWLSEPDDGQYDALNKGFARSTGEIMGWLNSDDLHAPWTLSVVASVFARFPEVEWITSLYPLIWGPEDSPVHCYPQSGFSGAAFMHGDNLPGAGWPASGWIQQESTFWRRSLWERAGGYLDTSVSLAADFELWTRFFQHAQLYGVAVPIAGFRAHDHQRTSELDDYRRQAEEVLMRYGGRRPSWLAALLRAKVRPAIPWQAVPAMARTRLIHPRPTCQREARGEWKVVLV